MLEKTSRGDEKDICFYRTTEAG